MIFCFVKDEKPLQWIRVAFKFIPSCKLHLRFCANINYLFEFIFSPENAKKLSKPLLYINMHQDSEHNSSNHAAHTAEVERNCCSEYHRSAVIPISVRRRLHCSCARDKSHCLLKNVCQKFKIHEYKSGKVEIRFWISHQVRFLLMRWGWGLGQKPNYKASDTWESWGLNDEMHFSTSIIQNAKIFLLLRNITSYTAPAALRL